jgi:urease accessory protein
MSGLSHPFLGLDHLLAMLAVGIWAGKMGGKASWCMPLVFIALLVASAVGSNMGVLGITSMTLVENGIALSLLLLGLFIVLPIKLPTFIGMMAVSLFAIFHGVAHGSQWPIAASPFWYASGFIVASGLLLTVGVMTCTARVERFQLSIRLVGMFIASTGGWMLLTN